MSDVILDLFGEPVSAERGPGRPAVEWTLEKSNKVRVLFAAGYEPKEVAPVIGCCLKTFRKVFSVECAERKTAALKLRAAMMVQLAEQGRQGNVAATKALHGMIEREQVRALSDRMIGKASAAAKKDRQAATPPAPVGKKATQAADAQRIEGLFGARKAPAALQG